MYEWFITDSFHTKTSVGLYHILRARCVTEDYDVSERFRIDETTLTCTALQHWLEKLGVPNETPLSYLKKSFRFLAAVQPKFNTTARKQFLYYELDALSLKSVGTEQVENKLSSEVDRIIALQLSRPETLAMLREKGNEYLKDARTRGLIT